MGLLCIDYWWFIMWIDVEGLEEICRLVLDGWFKIFVGLIFLLEMVVEVYWVRDSKNVGGKVVLKVDV